MSMSCQEFVFGSLLDEKMGYTFAQCFKFKVTFSGRNLRMFIISCKPYRPSVMCVTKAGAYPSEAQVYCHLRHHFFGETL
jgi:hypothetical protein